jgi:predicted metal-dependent hydrolase
MDRLTVSDIQVDVVRKAIRNIHLAVYPPTGRVRVATPKHVSDETLRLFVVSKLAWIRQQQRKFLGQERQTSREYAFRESHYYWGTRYLLRVIEQDTPPQVQVKGKRYLNLYVRPDRPVGYRHRVMREWYRARLKEAIPALVARWEPILGVCVRAWGVKQMKTRWGTCNASAGRIWLNLELAKKPPMCLEYIVVHEMLHLLERRHNEQFVALMDRHLPTWRSRRNELNRYPISHSEWEY